MTDDELISWIVARVPPTLPARASAIDVASEERALGFALPPFYVRLITEVANGGFGPSELTGIGPRGFPHPDHGVTLAEQYARERTLPKHAPRRLVPLHSWGAGKTSHLDCATPDGAIVTSEWLCATAKHDEGLGYWRTCPSIRVWMREWLERPADAWPDMTVNVLGYEERKNPFTGKLKSYPITEPRGERIDLSARCVPREE